MDWEALCRVKPSLGQRGIQQLHCFRLTGRKVSRKGWDGTPDGTPRIPGMKS